jgi:hypothetical protein
MKAPSDDAIPATRREQHTLSEVASRATLVAANSGDVAAAGRLYIYYSFGEYDYAGADHWCLTAARLGSECAQCALAVGLMDAQPPEMNKARKWAAAAEAAGSALGHHLACRIDDCLRRSGRESS